MPRLGGGEWLIIILLVLLLFGAKRLPDAARSMGRSLRIFKAETRGLMEDDSAAQSGGTTPAAADQQAPVAPPAVTGPAQATVNPEPTSAPGSEVPPKA